MKFSVGAAIRSQQIPFGHTLIWGGPKYLGHSKDYTIINMGSFNDKVSSIHLIFFGIQNYTRNRTFSVHPYYTEV